MKADISPTLQQPGELTKQVLLDALIHGFVNIKGFALLVFDEGL